MNALTPAQALLIQVRRDDGWPALDPDLRDAITEELATSPAAELTASTPASAFDLTDTAPGERFLRDLGLVRDHVDPAVMNDALADGE